jgi:predicted cupin superfamily sugar epimerase
VTTRDTSDADRLIDALGMRPHPEGGHYVETWRSPSGPDGRAAATAILFLLRDGERSHWHRVDADEIWLFHDGAPLALTVADGSTTQHQLGTELPDGQRPQVVVPAHAWQTATTTGAWTLVSCVVSPGFEYAGFVLAPPGWSPDGE